ncbi:MAG: gamma-type small acid-soluble spore protein [Bacillota bacterium]|nr:gamma-type small acid-soluble spore protein [Bacillota bacterium]MDP4171681.1 gamma-type small acid-soluble spore protein [Bacillota bacterium]
MVGGILLREQNSNNQDSFTVAGTNISEVKRKNEQSGMSYNEVKNWMAKTNRGHNTAKYSNTNAEKH